MNSFGTKFRISVFGESHGEAIGVVMDGVPAGIPLCEDDFYPDLGRRRSGVKGTTPRKESDKPEIVSGVFNGFATGAPLTVLFRNEDTRSGDYKNLAVHPRPSHADWTAFKKFGGFNDYRGGGHFSGRLTLTLVAAGVVAKKMLARDNVTVSSEILEIGGCTDKTRFGEVVENALREQDSVGGIIECTAENVRVGAGEPFFDSVESVMSHLLFSVPSVKGVEFGLGFGSARVPGSRNNDPIIDAGGRTATNNAGGINGGIANGNPIVVRVAVKPTPSIASEQNTYNTETGSVEPLVIKGRHDACIALRAPVVVEAAVAIALAQF